MPSRQEAIDILNQAHSGARELTPLPEPSAGMRTSAAFEVVWSCIKSWDIHVPESYAGYCGATGSHVAAILQALADAEVLDWENT
jgi:hypothetical protein